MTSVNGAETGTNQTTEEILQTELTDEAYEELAGLEGSVVQGITFWDTSLADELEEEPPADADRVLIDMDVYLEDNVLLELYGAALYRRAEDGPLVGLTALEQAIVDLIEGDSVLDEVAETTGGALALVFAQGDETLLIIAVSAWMINVWEELPDA